MSNLGKMEQDHREYIFEKKIVIFIFFLKMYKVVFVKYYFFL